MSAGLAGFLVPGTDDDVAASYAACIERARDAVFGFEDEVVLVDIETTGFDPARDGLIEIAAARMSGPEVLETFSTLVDPGRDLPAEIVRLTGITAADLEGAPAPDVAAEALAAFVGGRDMVAHNASFDRSFLEHIAGKGRFSGEWIDTLQLALIAFPRLTSHRLRDLSQAFGGEAPSHRAADDVRALGTVWRVVLCGLEALGPALLGRLAALAPDTPWPVRGVISHLAAGSSRLAFDLADARRARCGTEREPALPDAGDIEYACPSPAEVAADFAAGGVAGRMYPGYEHRGEQAEMARTVARAFAEGTHAAVEAGTGVGKSLAYLLPAVRFGLLNDVGVGIATKTNALMDQLVYGELPALCDALGEPLRYVALKGYEHYLCLRKLDRFAAGLGADDVASVGAVAALLSWVAESSWGDLAATNVHLTREMRNEVCASVADCTRKRCRFYPHLCYVHGARKHAASAHVVVTNHALLFRDVVADGGILPPIRHWVIDESHAAEGEARAQLSMDCSRLELTTVFTALGAPRVGLIDVIRRRQRELGGEEEGGMAATLAEMERGVAEGMTLVVSLFEFVRDVGGGEGSGYDIEEVRIHAGVREGAAWHTVARVGRSLATRIETVLAAGRRLVTDLEVSGPEATEVRADLVGALSRLAAQYAALITVLDGEASEYVYHLTIDRRPSGVSDRMAASTLDVGEALAEGFYPGVRSVVFTSATIAAGDDFSHFARALGLDRLERQEWSAVRLPSSYDFERQMAVFVPTDLVDPRSPEYLGRLEELLFELHIGMGGSVLTLFTNRRDMDSLHRALAPRLEAEGLGLLVQGRGVSTKRLRDEFLADERVSLFATKSFWEGFDAKGDTLRCVVVPKLPFGRMNDPLTSEREERYGRAAWERYYLPQAVIELKQAAGRLIRSSTDTGCLVIADARVVQKGYGRTFLAALPVNDIERLESAQVIEEITRRFAAPARS
ncbi:MAG: helicase C-terminal domain-containing protein [Coriobacteriia bacterium]|jgi:ATP-dependent DNA helicase DinG|nr:helicase C-terminal domain-containing protein [Coriobacteriia bacterium]